KALWPKCRHDAAGEARPDRKRRRERTLVVGGGRRSLGGLWLDERFAAWRRPGGARRGISLSRRHWALRLLRGARDQCGRKLAPPPAGTRPAPPARPGLASWQLARATAGRGAGSVGRLVPGQRSARLDGQARLRVGGAILARARLPA